MSILASDVMDGARAILNDSAVAGGSNFTNTVLLPFVKRASKKLEKILVIHGYTGEKIASSPITVPSATVNSTLTLPSDFLLPIRLFERSSGGTQADWIEMTEDDWLPENFVATTTLRFWSYRNLVINLPPCTTDREVLLEYERIIPAVTSANSPLENNTLIQAYLEAKVAEYAARFIAMNTSIANDIKVEEVDPAEDDMVRVLVLNQQGLRFRRQKFTTKRLTSTSLG